MKIISWNINGIRSACKETGLAKIAKLKPDLICLQEIKADIEQVKSLNLFEEYKLTVNPAQKKGYSGVAIFSKLKPTNISIRLYQDRFDQEGRFLLLDFDKFKVANIYIPHGGRQKENLGYKLEVYKKLFDLIRNNKNIILVGDFNIAHMPNDLARPKQNQGNIMFTPIEREQLDKIVKLKMVDGFRKDHSGNGFYTWWPYLANCRERNLGWRIDYTFVPKDLANKIISSSILPDYFGSDHCPTMLEIDL